MTDKITITIKRETLLPCPFCGDDGDKGRQEVTQMIEGRNKFARITCRACGAMCPEENWNQRAAQPVAGRINYGGILDALDGLPNDIKTEFEHIARLVREYGCQIGHCEHDKHSPAALEQRADPPAPKATP